MSTITLQKKRKNIDLPIETLQKLSIMAASQGKSLKAFIEYILEMKDTMLRWLDENSPNFRKRKSRAATKISYQKALLMYITLAIVYANK